MPPVPSSRSIDDAPGSVRGAQHRLDTLVAGPPAGAESPPALGRGLWTSALAAVAFLVVATVVRAACESVAPLSPFEEGSIERYKADVFGASADQFDLVFLGTSRTYRHFDPARFDRRMAERGRPLRSYNFGLAGLRHLESRQMVRWILEQQPARLRWLLIELTGEITRDPDGFLHEKNAYTRRAVQWHVPDLTSLVVGGVLGSDLSPAVQLDAVRTHLDHLGLRIANIGLGTQAARCLVDIERPAPLPYPRTDGHRTLDEEEPLDSRLEKRRKAFERKPEWLADQLAALRGRRTDGLPDAALAESLAVLLAEVRASGVEPVFVKMPPQWGLGVEMFGEETLHGLPNLIDLSDPDEHPEFYAAENMFNRHHLNARGAELLTNELARRFGEYLAARGG